MSTTATATSAPHRRTVLTVAMVAVVLVIAAVASIVGVATGGSETAPQPPAVTSVDGEFIPGLPRGIQR